MNSRLSLQTKDLAAKIFRLLKAYVRPEGLKLRLGIILDTTIINARGSTKKSIGGIHDLEKHKTRFGTL